jgi:hypothetical protein
MPIHRCPHGHEVRSSADRDTTGYCRQCRRDRNHDARRKQREAARLVRALDAMTPEDLARLLATPRADREGPGLRTNTQEEPN